VSRHPHDPPARRRDAEANRARIVAAAREVFASAGFGAPLDAVAQRAGVGRATLYRNFPDRFALGAAIFEHNLAALEALAREHCDRPDAFMTLLTAMVEQQIEAHALVPALLTGPQAPDLHALVRRVTRLLAAPLRRARTAALVRPDLTTTDVVAALAMVSAVAAGDASAPSRRRRVMRALELLLHGLVPRTSAAARVHAGA
jgi:AcrR family transcriptional regulator